MRNKHRRDADHGDWTAGVVRASVLLPALFGGMAVLILLEMLVEDSDKLGGGVRVRDAAVRRGHDGLAEGGVEVGAGVRHHAV